MDILPIIVQFSVFTLVAIIVSCRKQVTANRQSDSGKTAASESGKAISSQSRKPADRDFKIMPSQMRQIMEAEQMAKEMKGYENVDIENDKQDKGKANKNL